MRRIIYLVLIVFLALSFSCKKAKEGAAIKIGIIGPMQFLQGKGHWNGALLAQEEINDEGGVKVGDEMRKIELVKADSNEFLNVTDATNAMDRLITQDKVDFVIGGFRTEAVLAMQEIAMDAKKIFLGAGAAHPELCEKVGKDYGRYKYWFRITPINSKYLGKVCFINLATVGAIVKKVLGIEKPKVAIVAEKAVWVEPMVAAAKKVVPTLGLDIAGVWRPSPIAKDVTAELTDIERKGSHVVFTIFSSSVGVTFARQAGELKLPAAMVGINVEAQKDGFWDATQGKGNYAVSLNTFIKGLNYNDLTQPFVEKYIDKFGESPTYTAVSYEGVKMLAIAIEELGVVDTEKIIPFLEKLERPTVASAKTKFDKNHDLVFGPGFATGMTMQWQDGKMKGWWPNGWEGVTYEGMVDYQLPPWMIEKYKK